MEGRLSELKEKQEAIGDKISLLQQTNKKKDDEVTEIRQLIAECRENLNRIKGLAPGSEPILAPCAQFGEGEDGPKISSPCSEKKSAGEPEDGAERGRRPCSTMAPIEKNRCAEILGKRDCAPPEGSKKKKGRDKDRVSCKVYLNNMKIRIKGPPEDLKKLDATQLICLLEKFQCKELIINTGDEVIQDPGEIRLVYLLHPGNIIMVAGIIIIAFLIRTNLCSENTSCNMKFLLNVLYLGSFALHYGMVLWMSIIRDYALRFGLNHDTFHLVDNLILPKYYFVCVLLSAISLYSFLVTHCTSPCTSWPLQVLIQMIIVIMTFVLELMTSCYIIPALIKLRNATDDYIIDEEDMECPPPASYEKNLIKLGKLNWTVCVVNFLTLLLLGANIYYITSRLSIGNY